MSASREKRARQAAAQNPVQESPVHSSEQKKAARNKVFAIVGGILAVIVVAVVLVLYALSNSTYYQKHATAATVDGNDLTPATFNYYYRDAYYNYANTYSSIFSYMIDTSLPLDQQYYSEEEGKTWADFFVEQAKNSIRQTYTLLHAANEEGFALSESDAAQMDAQLEGLKTTAASYGYENPSDYLAAYYGEGCDLDSYKAYLSSQFLASAYYTAKMDGFTFSDDEVAAYYAENNSKYDTVDYRIFSYGFDAEDAEIDPDDGKIHRTQDEAKALADEMAETCRGDEQAFLDMAYANTADKAKENYDSADSYTLYEGYTSDYLPNQDVIDWFYDDARVEGDTYVNAMDNGYSVYYFLAHHADDYSNISYRNVLIPPEDSSDEESWNKALTLTQNLVKKWQDEMGADEDGFIEAAKKYSSDGSNYENGGLNENVGKENLSDEMVDWLWNADRTAGDYAIIQTTDGYNFVYYVGQTGSHRDAQIRSDLSSKAYTDWFDTASENITVTEGKGVKYIKK